MPWHLESDNPGCSGWAVVKDADGEIEGCHKTKDEALAQLAALTINVKEAPPMDGDERAAPPRENLIRASFPAIEVRAEQDDGMPTLVGYFARFNEWTRIESAFEGTFMERMAPGAFAKTLKEGRDRIRVLFQHGRDPQVGDKPLGPIRDVGEDDDGARYEVPLLDTTYNRDLLPGLAAGLYGSSFRFSVVKDDFDPKPKPSTHNPDGLPERTVREARVMEFGPVTFPAYAGAVAGVRSVTFDDLDAAIRPPEPALPADGAAPEAHSDEGSREQSPPLEAAAAPEAPDEPPDNRSAGVEYVSVDEKRAREREITDELAKIDGEYTGVLPPDEQARWDGLTDEQDKLRADIAAWETRQRRLAEQAAKPSTTEAAFSAPMVVKRPMEADIYDPRSWDLPTPEARKQKMRDNAMRAVETITTPHPKASTDRLRSDMAALLDHRDSEDKEFAHRVLTTNSPQYRREFERYVRSGGLERGTALAVGVDGTGGYAVPVAFDPTVLAIGAHTTTNPYRQVCRVQTIVGTDTYQVLTSTAVTAAYATEAAAATEQGPTFARPEFIAKRAHAFVTASYEMAQDRPDLAAELAVLFQEAKDNLEENQFSIGVGTTVYPQGIALDGAFTAVTTATNDVTAVGDLLLVEAALPLRHRSNAVWFLTRKGIRAIAAWETVHGELFNQQYYGASGMLGRPTAFGNTGMQLYGYPVFEAPSIPWTPTTDATINGVLFNPDFYLILDRIGMSVKVIPDMLNGATPSFPTGEIGIYAFWRNTARVIAADAGRQLKVQ